MASTGDLFSVLIKNSRFFGKKCDQAWRCSAAPYLPKRLFALGLRCPAEAPPGMTSQRTFGVVLAAADAG
ncbi:MAG: hypothetical protein K2W93_01820, partial [Burkholderiaceae bacterium]|nr:hypothetical protein [Burkholderiaceae bacterium]